VSDESDAEDEAPSREPSEAPDPFPTFVCQLPSPRAASRTLARQVSAVAVTAATFAVWAWEAGHTGTAEVAALATGLVLAIAIPARELARRYASAPDRAALFLGREGFRLPWLMDSDAPGAEGPWEALRGFRVVRRRGAGASSPRALLLQVAAGSLLVAERAIGTEAFEAALAALERAVGPGGVFLGSVVRLPVSPPDDRSRWDRTRPLLPSVGLALGLVGLATVADSIAVRALAGALAVLWLWAQLVRGFEAAPRADLAIGLDGLAAPLPLRPRRTIKVPVRSVLRSGVVREADGTYLVIEHERGRLAYPLEWLDERYTRAFAEALEARGRDPG
jgi:hypothetical protein